MLEKLLARLAEVEKLFETGLANLNALNGAKQELQSLIAQQQEADASCSAPDNLGEVV